MARGLTQQLLMGGTQPQPRVNFAIAKSFRQMVSGPGIAWTKADGGPKSHVYVIDLCNWWLLVPRLSMQSTLDTSIQPLTRKEQREITYGNGQVAVAAGGAALDTEVAVDYEEDIFANEEDMAVGDGGGMQLDV